MKQSPRSRACQVGAAGRAMRERQHVIARVLPSASYLTAVTESAPAAAVLDLILRCGAVGSEPGAAAESGSMRPADRMGRAVWPLEGQPEAGGRAESVRCLLSMVARRDAATSVRLENVHALRGQRKCVRASVGGSRAVCPRFETDGDMDHAGHQIRNNVAALGGFCSNALAARTSNVVQPPSVRCVKRPSAGYPDIQWPSIIMMCRSLQASFPALTWSHNVERISFT